MARVCLINPPTSDPDAYGVYFPLALLTLGAVLRGKSVAVDVWDLDLHFKKIGNATERDFRNLIRDKVDRSGAMVFGISSICSNFPMALWIAREIKKYRSDLLIILGGPQPSSLPREILETFDFVDIVVPGEGEQVIEDMADVSFDMNRLSQVPGVAFRVKGKIQINPRRPLASNLDDFPPPDYSLIRLEDYRGLTAHADRMPTLEVGRGCPYACTFCSTSLMWDRSFRVKSPRRILDEMEALHEAYGFTEFGFVHDNFTTSKDFLRRFCDFMERENNKHFKWHASSRPDCLDLEQLERLHSAGLSGLFFGVETGSERMQRVIHKGLRFEHFEPLLCRANELGINVTTAFVIGFPEEEAADLDETVHKALYYKSLGTRNILYGKLTVYTGTALHQEWVARLKDLTIAPSPSPLYYNLPYIQELVRNRPDLFSSFYHIPHPRFSAEFLKGFFALAELLLDAHSKVALMIMDGLELGATALFGMWDRWAVEKQIPYQETENHGYSVARFRGDFQRFLDEVIFKDRADQRGVARPQGSACDIGAYELEMPRSFRVDGLTPPALNHLD